MDKDAYFDAMVSMFGHEGWKVLMMEVDTMIENTKDAIMSAPTWDNTVHLRGRLQAFQELRTLETVLRKQIEEEQEAANADV